jgi:hypothetical protein
MRAVEHEKCYERRYAGILTWTTRDPVSWQAREAHFPLSDLLTLHQNCNRQKDINLLANKYPDNVKIGGAGAVQVNSIICIDSGSGLNGV